MRCRRGSWASIFSVVEGDRVKKISTPATCTHKSRSDPTIVSRWIQRRKETRKLKRFVGAGGGGWWW